VRYELARHLGIAMHGRDLAGGGKDWFPKNTSVLVAEPRELSPAMFLKSAILDKVITLEGQLKPSTTNALRECVRVCPDVSNAQKDLL
jgi:hypothetical protein